LLANPGGVSRKSIDETFATSIDVAELSGCRYSCRTSFDPDCKQSGPPGPSGFQQVGSFVFRPLS
jgi:hypothetical protein